MKKIIFILILFLSNSISAQNISEVIYKKKTNAVLKDSTVHNAGAELIRKTIKLSSKIAYKLLFDKTHSLFKQIENLELESNNGLAFLLSSSLGGIYGSYAVFVAKDSVVNQKSFHEDLFRITSKLSDKNWKIDFKTSKKIGDYTCYKALGEKRTLMPSGNIKVFPVTAWFAPKLPFSFGPAEYAGLPGLILELEIRKTVIYADKITLNKKLTKKEQGIKPLKKGILLSSEDYIKMQKSGGVYKRPKR